MLNPLRPEIEKLLFKTEADVYAMLKNMEDALEMIERIQLTDDPNKESVISANREYIAGCLGFESIKNATVDLGKYQF